MIKDFQHYKWQNLLSRFKKNSTESALYFSPGQSNSKNYGGLGYNSMMYLVRRRMLIVAERLFRTKMEQNLAKMCMKVSCAQRGLPAVRSSGRDDCVEGQSG
ncbi:hypothetical protein [Maribellus sediminis]|uniref:hypothetical protein n=1 Tax=Maribellus sediminis TaxID=2696285 RepID=UPI0014313F60|nr:hypothetical protein [Maribellus sediminis]